ncbi:MAG: MBL fold metallo-hydrolase [Candidatus Neomarinimicrobiota bacterium]|nr:MAG: MBL fold metallo-hydrolase [Candidatus Neomarinimicrobiota bacterium]
MASLQFLGATGTVTGSKYVFSHKNSNIMVDCGLFQGLKELRLRNWAPLKIDVNDLDAIVLTHAHIDHTGYLPRLIKQGYNKPVYCTEPTRDLLEIMLLDSAHLQEEDAKYANKKGISKHSPAMPLYSIEDARKAIGLLKGIPYEVPFHPSHEVIIRFQDAGHILGSAFVNVHWQEEDGEEKKILFSGDLGRFKRPILKDPTIVSDADYLLVESTYGNRLHEQGDPKNELKRIINDTISRKGVVVIPSFAVGRTQELLYTLRELENTGDIPVLPVYVDSPMAIKATKLYSKHTEIYDKEANALKEQGVDVLLTQRTEFTESVDASKRINASNQPCIIISASGMMTGGRILHHLIRRLPSPKNSIIFVGYQAEGTRGRALQRGNDKIKIHGQQVKSAAAIETISDFSAHADYNEILNWLGNFEKAPKKTFIVHGEPESSLNLKKLIDEKFAWFTHIPVYEEVVELN